MVRAFKDKEGRTLCKVPKISWHNMSHGELHILKENDKTCIDLLHPSVGPHKEFDCSNHADVPI